MDECVVVVKIGGGSVTEKNSPAPVLLKENLATVCQCLKRAAVQKRRLVVVLGAGSFGHGKAKTSGFSTKTGVTASETARLNACDVRDQVLQLCSFVEREMRACDLPCLRYTPMSWSEDALTRTIIPEGKLFCFVFFFLLFNMNSFAVA
jgi:isopentenyl phosphate kinase